MRRRESDPKSVLLLDLPNSQVRAVYVGGGQGSVCRNMGGDVDPQNGDCLRCGAAQAEVCRWNRPR